MGPQVQISSCIDSGGYPDGYYSKDVQSWYEYVIHGFRLMYAVTDISYMFTYK